MSIQEVSEEQIESSYKSQLDQSLAQMTREYENIRPQYSDSQFPANLVSLIG
jgi:hypothetical protein